MIKIFGALFILISTTGLGFTYARRYAERPHQLRQLQSAFEQLETDILYRADPLAVSFERIAHQIQYPVGKLFAHFVRLVNKSDGLSTSACWEQALSEVWPSMALKKNEIEALRQFGHNLGNSDREDQVKHIRALLRILHTEEREAREEQQKYEKMSRTLGVLGGLFIVILMY